MEALRAVFAKLGFEIDTQKVVDASKQFDKLVDRVLSAGVAFKSLSAASGLIKEQIEAATQVKMLGQQFQLTTDEVQKYKFAAEQVGVTTQQMVTAFKTLGNHMGAGTTMTGMQHAIKMFGQYGISTKDAEGKMEGVPGMLGKIADKMKTMTNAAQRIRFANEMMGEMGFRLIPLLMNGSEGVKAFFEQFKTLNLTMSEGFINAATLTGQKLKLLKTAFNVFKSEIAYGALPWVQRMATWLTRLSSNATDVARKTTWMTTAWVAFGTLVAAALARAAGGVWQLFVMMVRFAIPLAIMGLIYLIFDDFFGLLTGKKSLVGELLDEMYGAGEAAKFANQLRDAWKEVTKVLGELFPSLKEIGKMLMSVIPMAVRGTAYVLQGLVESIKTVHGWLEKLFAFNDLRANANAVYDRVIADGGSKADADAAKTKYLWEQKAKQANATFDMSPAAAQRSGTMSDNWGVGTRHPDVTITKGDTNVKIVVQGNADKETVQKIREEGSRIGNGMDLDDAAAQTGLHGAM